VTKKQKSVYTGWSEKKKPFDLARDAEFQKVWDSIKAPELNWNAPENYDWEAGRVVAVL